MFADIPSSNKRADAGTKYRKPGRNKYIVPLYDLLLKIKYRRGEERHKLNRFSIIVGTGNPSPISLYMSSLVAAKLRVLTFNVWFASFEMV